MVGVDLALGPLLTLVVFKSGKKGLKFDLTLIGLLQTVALVYGLSIVLQSRPVFLLAVIDRFELISASDLDATDLVKGTRPSFARCLSQGRAWRRAGCQPQRRIAAACCSRLSAARTSTRFPEYYVEYAAAAAGLLKHAKPLESLKISDGEERKALDDALAGLRKPAAEIVWVPLTALKANIVMLLDRANGEPLQAVAVNPWPN